MNIYNIFYFKFYARKNAVRVLPVVGKLAPVFYGLL